MTRQIQCAIIIPFYKGHAYLNELLASISPSAHLLYTVYLADNGPQQARLTPEQLDALDASLPLTLLSLHPGVGFGRACNAGAYRAIEDGAELLIVLNQDTRIQADAFERLTAPLLEGTADVTGPVQLKYKADILDEFCRKLISGLPELSHVTTPDELPERVITVKNLNGACLAMKADLVKELGLFDPLFTMYGEDDDFMRRVARADKRIALVTASRIEHVHSHLSATEQQKIQIAVWKSEYSSIMLLKDHHVSLREAITYFVTRRAWNYLKYASTPSRQAYWKLLLESDRKFLNRLPEYYRLRVDNERVQQRAERYYRRDTLDVCVSSTSD